MTFVDPIGDMLTRIRNGQMRSLNKISIPFSTFRSKILEVLKKDIGTNNNAITKFFVFVKKDKVPKDIKKEKTSIVFKSKHYPGALVNCLQRLSKNNINMTQLESRPIMENPWEYIFYVDFIGGLDDENVKLALSEMEAASIFVKVLGSYPEGNKS